MAKTHLIKCGCGARYSVEQKQVGKKTKCKKCGKRFVIPTSEKKETDLGAFSQVVEVKAKSDSARSSCPDCGKAMDVGKTLCQNCGYHQKLGYRLKSIADAQFSENPLVAAPLYYALIISFGLIFLTSQINESIEGPSFLALFLGCFIAFGIATPIFRKTIQDADFIQDAALVGLIGMGITRIYYSIANERYKFMLLIFGMTLAFAVFFLSKTRNRKQLDSPFVSDTGGLHQTRYWWLFGIGTIVLTVCFFSPGFRSAGQGLLIATVIAGFIILYQASVFAGLEAGTGHGSGGSWGDSSSSSCSSSSCSSSSCGGGGCGGGCGGGGCGG